MTRPLQSGDLVTVRGVVEVGHTDKIGQAEITIGNHTFLASEVEIVSVFKRPEPTMGVWLPRREIRGEKANERTSNS